MKRNIDEAIRALTEKPIFSVTYERFFIMDRIKSDYTGLPQPLKFSRILTTLLSEVSTPIKEYDLIAGRALDRELSPEEDIRFREFLRHPDYPQRRVIFGSGHSSYDWDMLVSLGLDGLRERALARMSGEDDPEKRIFLSATVEIYSAISLYIQRYEEKARKMGLFDLADALSDASHSAPKTFRGALQLVFIVALINCAYLTPNPTLTLGRLDVILYPLYKKGIESGELSEEMAGRLITDYYCKHNLMMGRGEHQLGTPENSTGFDRIFNFDAPQYLMIGGSDRHGNPSSNELSLLFARCIVKGFKNPVVVVRYTDSMNEHFPELFKVLSEKATESASLMFYNDRNLKLCFNRMGIPYDECDYILFGCNWPSPGTNGSWMLGGPSSLAFDVDSSLSDEEKAYLRRPFMRTRSEHSWPQDFCEILESLAEDEKAGASVSIEDFYREMFYRISEFTERKLEYLEKELLARQRHSSSLLTFTDCFLDESLENAACHAARAKYHFEVHPFQMFATVTDCFTVIDKIVFKDKKASLADFCSAIKNNFEGHDCLLALIRGTDKFGSDSELSNYHAKRISDGFALITYEKSKPYFERLGLFLEPSLQSDTWHIKYGSSYGATPDGRLAKMPYSQNSRPSNGSSKNGITALLSSMLVHSPDSYMSGALNLDIQKNLYTGEEGVARFSQILSNYFNCGGLHAQVSAISKEELIEAQKNPQLHRDILVRVTGYSGIFVDMCRSLQNDIIARTE